MNSQKIKINGIDIDIPNGMKTKELNDYICLDSNHFFAERNPFGQSSSILNNNSMLPQKSNLELVTLPRFKQGFDSRENRIHREVNKISYTYPVLYEEGKLSYLAIKNFLLNSNFNLTSTTLLIKIPPKYPFTPPEHFYLKKGLLYKGKSPTHYFQNAGFNDLSEEGWSKFCLHVKSWKPSKDIISGDSLITFLELIQIVFDNLEREEI